MIKNILKPHIPCCRCGNSKLGLGFNQASSLAMNDGTITCPECGLVGLVQFRHLLPVLLAIPASLLWLSPTTTSAVVIDAIVLVVWLFFVVRYTFRMVHASTQ